MIISISGKINSGKDEIARIILEATSYKFIVRRFADSLKDMVCILLGCTREQLEDRVFKETELGEEWWYYKCGNLFDGYELHNYKNESYEDLAYIYNKSNVELIKPTPRLLMQLLGTECGRKLIHPNIWVNALMSEYRPYIDAPDGVVPKDWESKWIITDVRFPNELNAVKDKEGITIRVNRFKEKDKVYWTDPDTTEFAEGASSGVYSIIKLYDEFCLLSNDVGSETEVPYDEIKLWIEDQHESETALDNYDKFDFIINNKDLKETINTIRNILIEEELL